MLFGTAKALRWLAELGGVACGGDGALMWSEIDGGWLASERPRSVQRLAVRGRTGAERWFRTFSRRPVRRCV
jgi:hypothetical protein